MALAESTITFTPVGWDELSNKFGGSREYILRGMNTSFKRMGKEVLVPVLKSKTPIGATKALKNKTVAQVLGQGDNMRLEIRQSAFNGKYPYGVGVRMGTRAHFPPYRALIPWVSVKMKIGGPEASRVAFLVARKISKVGTKSNNYHIKAFEESKPQLIDITKFEIEKVVKSLA